MASRKNSILFILFIFLLLLWHCKVKEEESIRLIVFQGPELTRFSNRSISFSELDSGGYGSILTYNGDWLMANEFLFSVQENLPDTISLRHEDSLIYVNGDLAGISISKESPTLSFFHQLSAEEITNLRSIQLNDYLWDSIKPYLQKIALLNPSVDIVFINEYDSAEQLNQDLIWFSQYFHPRAMLFGVETDSTTLSSLEKFPYLESLFLLIPENETGIIPNLPNLKEMILSNPSDSISIGSGYFKENLDLEKLTIIDYGRKKGDWPTWHMLKNIRHLSIYSDSILLYDVFGYHPKLSSLHLDLGGEGASISSIFRKNKLQWLSVYTEQSIISHNLKVLCDSFPQLEYLEFENEDTLLDYRNFRNIEKLKYLVVSNEVGLDTTIKYLQNLKYLSLPYDYLDDSVAVDRLQKDLPNTIITPNSGACLGSGWLLLLIPIGGIWFYFSATSKCYQ